MISILMATYNGEQYIEEQIDSLLRQTVQDFTLYIQDDCSFDRTWDIVQQYERDYSSRIVTSRLDKNTGSARYNFYNMFSRFRDDYIMQCDQDDVWLPDKIEKTLAKMKEMEQIYGKNTPLLVHTDLHVVDEALNMINPSFKAAMNANYNRTRLNDLIIQNTLTGCTCMYNQALAELIGEETPHYLVMHDWWLMLIASAFGRIGHIDDPTVLYRQHGKNEIGAQDVRTLSYKLKKLIAYKDIKEAIEQTYLQTYSFLQCYRDKLSLEQVDLLTNYCKIPQKNKIQKWAAILRLRTFKNGITRNIAHFIFV